MLIDFFNSYLELWAFLVFFLIYSNWSMSTSQFVVYSVSSAILSFLFSAVLLPQILFLNIVLVLGNIMITFWRNSLSARFTCATLSILSILFLEFTIYSLFPESLLHTDIGNLIANLIILAGSGFTLHRLKKTHSRAILSAFLAKYSYILVLLLLILIILGQVYISKLSSEWNLLPAIVGIIFLFSIVLCLTIYIHFIKTTNEKQNALFTQNLENTENIIKACHIDLHNYHSHINHLVNSINSIDDIDVLRKEIHQYVSDFETDRELIESIVALKEPLFRSTIYGWYIRSLDQNIPFSFDASPLLPAFPIKQYLLVEAMDILFNNALEHELLLSKEKRLIHISLYSDSDISSFTISNNVADIEQSLSDIYSGRSQKKGAHKGIGLKHVAHLCEEHHLQFSNSADIESSSISFSICYKKESK